MELFWWEPKTTAELADGLGLARTETRAVVESLEDRGLAVRVRGDDGCAGCGASSQTNDRRRVQQREAAMTAAEAQNERVIGAPLR